MTTENDPNSEIDRDAVLAGLSKLNLFDYERVREGEARRLKIRVSVLDDVVERIRNAGKREAKKISALASVEPWPDAINGADLLEAIAAVLSSYVVLTKDDRTRRSPSADGMALWIIHSHAHDAFLVSALLAIESAERRCGKTKLLAILEWLTPRALVTANATSAGLFRIIERDKPTLLIDEGDTFLKAKEEMRGILNSGQTRTSAFVLRTAEADGELEPRLFSTWAPKIIALIGELPGTLQDRSIVIPLRRKLKGEHIRKFRADRTEDLAILNRKAARWAADHFDALRNADPDVPAELNDRAADNWRPLFAIADVVGGTWPEIARNAALALSSDGDGQDDEEPGIRLLADCKAIFDAPPRDVLEPLQLLYELHDLEEAPWREWLHGKPITARGLAILLKPFEIRSSAPTRAFGGVKRRLYHRNDFNDAWERYLPRPIESHDQPDPAA